MSQLVSSSISQLDRWTVRSISIFALTTNLSYRFPILEASATALCGTTGIHYVMNWMRWHFVLLDDFFWRRMKVQRGLLKDAWSSFWRLTYMASSICRTTWPAVAVAMMRWTLMRSFLRRAPNGVKGIWGQNSQSVLTLSYRWACITCLLTHWRDWGNE